MIGKSSTVKDLDGNNYDLVWIIDWYLLGVNEKQQTICQDCWCANHDEKTAYPEFLVNYYIPPLPLCQPVQYT
jgi:aspartyl-tRNA synthetase